MEKLEDVPEEENQPDAPHCTTCTCATRVLHAVGAELPVGHQEEDRQVGLEQDHIWSHGRQLPPELRQQPRREVQGGDPQEAGQDGGSASVGGFPEEERKSESVTGEGEALSDRVKETEARSVMASAPLPAPDQEILQPDDDEDDEYESDQCYNVIDLSEESSDNSDVDEDTFRKIIEFDQIFTEMINGDSSSENKRKHDDNENENENDPKKIKGDKI